MIRMIISLKSVLSIKKPAIILSLASVKQSILIIILLLTFSQLCFGQKGPSRKTLKLTAPKEFVVVFTTTAGEFKVIAHREWDPVGVDRFYQLVKSKFFEDIAIFRVQPNYVAQFGISDNTSLNDAWEKIPIIDSDVKTSNTKGTISFAREGPETRTTQLFINLEDNYKLDTLSYNGLKGFPPIAEIVKGMEVIDMFYDAYGSEPSEKQELIYLRGNKWLRKNYPKLDYIIEVQFVEEN